MINYKKIITKQERNKKNEAFNYLTVCLWVWKLFYIKLIIACKLVSLNYGQIKFSKLTL